MLRWPIIYNYARDIVHVKALMFQVVFSENLQGRLKAINFNNIDVFWIMIIMSSQPIYSRGRDPGDGNEILS